MIDLGMCTGCEDVRFRGNIRTVSARVYGEPRYSKGRVRGRKETTVTGVGTLIEPGLFRWCCPGCGTSCSFDFSDALV